MTDDLVKRLRDAPQCYCYAGLDSDKIHDDAADRIEALERLYVGALNDGERVYGDLVECRGMVDTARNEALEEAARVAEEQTAGWFDARSYVGQSIAAAIRALMEK